MLNSTLGTFAYGGTTFHVEHHSGIAADYLKITTVRAHRTETAAALMIGPHAVIGAVKPEPGWEAPGERLEAFKTGAQGVLAQSAADGRGPWAGLERLG